MELRRIAKNGHSYQVTLPQSYLVALKLRPRDVVCVELVHETIVISRAISEREFSGPSSRNGPRESSSR